MRLLESLIKRGKKAYNDFRAQSRKATRQTRLRLERARLQRERKELLGRLGGEVLSLHRQGMVLHDTLEPALAKIVRLEAEIDRKSEALKRAEGELEPPGERPEATL